MPRENSKERRPETLGTGVFDVDEFQTYSEKEPNIVGVYRDGIDFRHITVRNFEPGQVTELHIHPENAHCIYILEGSGEVLYEDRAPVPIKAGQFWIVPRNVQHGLRNTGGTRLSYLGVNGGAEPPSGGSD